MALRRSSFASLSALRSSALRLRLSATSEGSVSLHEGQRFANPGLPGLNSNSSPQTTHVLIGNAIPK